MTKTNSPSVRPRRRWFLTIVVWPVAAVLGAVLAGTVLWQRALPEMEGRHPLKGLQAAVEVYRDAQAVPHIFAGNRADALRALGYLHAADRFFMMEMNRRAGQGRLAEVVGPDMLGIDKFLRTLGVYRLAQKSYDHFRPDQQALFVAYAEGVNAWLAAHHDKLPVEFTVLGFAPEPWRPADSIVWGKLMALRLSQNMQGELERAALRAKFPSEMVERLYPPYPQDAPVTIQPDFAVPTGKMIPTVKPDAGKAKKSKLRQRQGAPDSPKPRAATPSAITPTLGQAFAHLAAAWPFPPTGASNEWVVSGSRTASGQPILANDPHLGLETPVLWYLARLITPDGELKGATVPGLPVVLLGQNDAIAWGFTTTNSDVQDVFIEALSPQNPTRYLTPDGDAPFITRREVIKVKGQPDVVLNVRATRHGPVISDSDAAAKAALADDEHVLSLAFTGLGEADTTAGALLDLNAARDWPGFLQALQTYQTPPQNIVYADRAGAIGFINPGLVPVRKAGDGRYPVEGASGAFDWQGTIAFAQLPQLINPPGGVILNANNAVVGHDIAAYGRSWDTPYRAQRIAELLQPLRKSSVTDHAAIQGDILALPARQLVPALLALLPRDGLAPDETLARDLLQDWDGAMLASRPEPLLFEWWLMRLYDALLRPPFGGAATQQYNALAVQQVLANPSGWCDRRIQPRSADCAPQVRAALQQTLSELTVRYGEDIRTWRWGSEHFAPMPNKVLGHVPGFNKFFGLEHFSDGGFYTVNRGGNFDENGKTHPLIKTHGGGYRALYDLADPANSRFMIATGQSGHPLSPYYANLLPLWRTNQSVTLSGSAADFAAQHNGHLTFVP
jgi:penicillin G amidase